MLLPKIMFLTPILGINIKPAIKVPMILPIVDKDDIFPDTFPTSFSSSFFNLTAIGDAVANIKLGIPNKNIADMIATVIKLGIVSANWFTIIVSNIDIKLVLIAEININCDKSFRSLFLSAIFPPTQYPKLMLISMIPIIVVQMRLELPTYGDNTLAATSSNTIPIAPHIKTVNSSL